MRILDIIVIAGIVLALFGPKTLQSLARNAGKTTGGVKNAKDKFMAHEDVSSVHSALTKVPTNSQQALNMIVSSNDNGTQAAAVDNQNVINPTPSTETAPKNS